MDDLDKKKYEEHQKDLIEKTINFKLNQFDSYKMKMYITAWLMHVNDYNHLGKVIKVDFWSWRRFFNYTIILEYLDKISKEGNIICIFEYSSKRCEEILKKYGVKALQEFVSRDSKLT